VVVQEPKEPGLEDLVCEMSKLKRDFDLKWEVLLAYIGKEKGPATQAEKVATKCQSLVEGSEPILVQDFERMRLSATIGTLNS
jgi:hypothetical protein